MNYNYYYYYASIKHDKKFGSFKHVVRYLISELCCGKNQIERGKEVEFSKLTSESRFKW